MESEGARQLMLGASRLIIRERGARDNTEIRQLEMRIQQMTIVQIPEIATIRNATGGNERQQRTRGRDEELNTKQEKENKQKQKQKKKN